MYGVKTGIRMYIESQEKKTFFTKIDKGLKSMQVEVKKEKKEYLCVKGGGEKKCAQKGR